MEIAGLPLHPLVVHAAVVLTPLAAVLAIVFAVVPKWRYLTRWPTAVLAVIAFLSIWTARITGRSFVNANPALAPLVKTHQQRGTFLSLLMILFLVVVLAAVWYLGGASGFATGAGAREVRGGALDTVLIVLVIIASLLVLVWVFLTGDAGARAVFGR